MSSQPVGGMRDNRTGEYSNNHGGRQDKPDVLRLQSALAQERWHKWRLHAECPIEQGVSVQKEPERRRSGHAMEPTAPPAHRRPSFRRRPRAARPASQVNDAVPWPMGATLGERAGEMGRWRSAGPTMVGDRSCTTTCRTGRHQDRCIVSPSSELACAMISARHEIDDLIYQSIRPVAGQLSKYFVPIATSCVV